MTMKTSQQNARGRGDWQGMNWIRQEKRLAIYLRDGLACVWCGAAVETGVTLSLDHLIPHSRGGSNHQRNLVTCCKRCNDSRGARSLKRFAAAVADYVNHNVKPEAILTHVLSTRNNDLTPFLAEAKRLIARRGSAFAVLKAKHSS